MAQKTKNTPTTPTAIATPTMATRLAWVLRSNPRLAQASRAAPAGMATSPRARSHGGRRPPPAARRPGLRAGRGVRRSGRGPDGRLHRRPPFGGAGAGAAARPPPPGITSGAGQDFGQLFSMSPSTPLSEPGPFWKYLTMPVQKLPDPTADGIWSEASNRAVPDARAVVSTVDGSPSCLLA